MEIIQLKIVKEIYAARSLSKASMRLGKAPSIVSRHLTAFEKECGGRIFHRTGRGVQLTELGEQILPQIDLIIQALERMVDSGKTSSAIAGTVRVNVSPVICESLVPALYASIQQDYPLIRLQFFEGYSSQIDTALEKGATDVAVFLRNGTSAGSNHEAICQYDTYLISLPRTRLPGAAVVGRQEILFSDLEGFPSRVSRAAPSARWPRAGAFRCPSPPRSTRWPAWRRCFMPMRATSSRRSAAARQRKPGTSAATSARVA
jgi:LysR family transcriptional regulator, nitrogen assimilation regulatory protein